MTGYREENKLIMDKNAPIGVFDSGVGGLTVAREIMRQIPNERIVYFGDTARVPYGSKSKDNIIKFSRQIIRFLQTENVKAIVIACNTASALALDEMQQSLTFRFLVLLSREQRWQLRLLLIKELVLLERKQI